MKTQVRQQLDALQIVLRLHGLWEAEAPSEDKLASTQPFAIDTLSATQWLQWIFLPRMHALLDANAPLPQAMAISPYLEESLKHETYLPALLTAMQAIERTLRSHTV